MSRCPHCGGGDLIYDKSRGDTVCGNPACGEIIEEKAMEWETQFVELKGRISAAGSQVKWTGAGNIAAPGSYNYDAMIAKGVQKITYIADRLSLDASLQDAGRRVYSQCVQRDFTHGRSTRLVASSCLYLVCRRQKIPLLLMDFADVLHAPVRKLGQVYCRLRELLMLNEVPIIDPSVYVERFSRHLPLGDKQRRVQITASKIIQFMHRDWICIGRRPNGLCGAALLLACGYHGVPCASKEVADLVRISEVTMRSRFEEMEATPLALMDLPALEKAKPSAMPIEDGKRALPPCMRKRLRQSKAGAQVALGDVEAAKRPALPDGEPESAAAKRKRRKLSLPILADGKPLEEPLGGGGSSSSSAAPAPIADGVAATGEVKAAEPIKKGKTELYTAPAPSPAELEHIAAEIGQQLKGNTSKTDQGVVLDDAATKGLGELLVQKTVPQEEADDKAVISAEASVEERAVSETLSDVDDEELDEMLLNPEEAQHKSDIWHEVNKDYLQEWHERSQESRRRREERAASQADSASVGGSSRKSRRGFPKAESPAHSLSMALAKRGVPSDRINIDQLNSLFEL
eukprot:TRINITY_DN26868_c0_g1_i1.p1 TRINITY_DN26868_c0_g1~~TRINITY_DN26868_c0_g1_i1.p1  ORF type:complete len:574 (+),score=135.65 TRINITY_DN26868_c0_g1_i1:72-1793(+)